MPKKRAPAKSKARGKSPKRAKATRKGHGGARAGAGAKRDRIPQTVVDSLGAPPTDAKGLDLWCRRVLAEVLVLQMTGGIGTELAASVRATVGEVRRGLSAAPEDDGDEDDEDDEDGDGPELEEVGDDGYLRVE